MDEPKRKKRKLIGWREWVNLPELGVSPIKVKVDSGARTSALHATKIRFLKGEGETTTVSFVVTQSKKPRQEIRVRAPLVERRLVRSSTGQASLRPVIRTMLDLGGERWPIEITLVDRDPMGFRMLLGRSAIRSRFLIHPAKGFIQSEKREDEE